MSIWIISAAKMCVSIFRQADNVHQARLCPLCYIIKPLSSLTTLSPRAWHGAKHNIFL